MTSAAPPSRGANPFPTSGVARDAEGVLRYTGLARSVPELLRASVARDPGAEALAVVGGERLTYAELWDRAAHVAGGLRAAGIAPGDRVAIRLPNGAEWVLAFLGSMLAGAVPVPVNTRFTEAEAAYVVEDSGAAYVFAPGDALPGGPPVEPGEDAAGGADLAAIFYTSGTTGVPKGAMQTHENLLGNAETALRVMDVPDGIGRELRTLIVVPLFHVTGCHSQLLVALQAGGTAVVDVAFDGPRMLETLRDEQITSCVAVPAIYHYILHHPAFDPAAVDHVRWASYGGAPISPTLVGQIQKGFRRARVGNGFGQTESTSISTFLPHEWAGEHADSVGFPAPHTEVMVADPDPDTGVGELLIRGGGVCAGYWGKPRETAETVADGWLHTGDLGRIDEHGLVYVMDRIKDMINRGGENVYSVEVENGLVGAPGVGEVAVVGVPDEMMGEKVGAVLVPLPGATLDVDAVLAHGRERLADFKLPQYVAVRDAPLPRNPNGKVLKASLRDETDWGAPRR
ncbi:MAG: long-chain acyl-CoA synthetase [Baekduia sp.]|nr:long-chain acyl-CoA synthetase [Baekduia sp.]